MIELTKEKVGIEPVDNPDMTASGRLYIPDQAQGRSNQGIVKYKGPDTDDFEVGDYVLFSPYNGTLVILESERIIICHRDYITCKIDPPENVTAKEVPGLFFKSPAGNYFNATYETAMRFISLAVQESEFRKTNKVRFKYTQQERENFRKNNPAIDFSKDI